MWHFWGEKEILTQPFKVKGINKETGEEITVFEYPTNNILAPNNGGDHHIPSMMMLPSTGRWELESYFGGIIWKYYCECRREIKPFFELKVAII
ncbi:MAG: hypothetical protein WAM95_13735 [Bacillus sp. (in: firmicutes)]